MLLHLLPPTNKFLHLLNYTNFSSPQIGGTKEFNCALCGTFTESLLVLLLQLLSTCTYIQPLIHPQRESQVHKLGHATHAAALHPNFWPTFHIHGVCCCSSHHHQQTIHHQTINDSESVLYSCRAFAATTTTIRQSIFSTPRGDLRNPCLEVFHMVVHQQHVLQPPNDDTTMNGFEWCGVPGGWNKGSVVEMSFWSSCRLHSVASSVLLL